MILFACGALIAGCTTPLTGHGTATTAATSASPSKSSSATISLSDCSRQLNIGDADIPSSRLRHLTFQCGKVPVPLDYDNPTGPTIQI